MKRQVYNEIIGQDTNAAKLLLILGLNFQDFNGHFVDSRITQKGDLIEILTSASEEDTTTHAWVRCAEVKKVKLLNNTTNYSVMLFEVPEDSLNVTKDLWQMLHGSGKPELTFEERLNQAREALINSTPSETMQKTQASLEKNATEAARKAQLAQQQKRKIKDYISPLVPAEVGLKQHLKEEAIKDISSGKISAK